MDVYDLSQQPLSPTHLDYARRRLLVLGDESLRLSLDQFISPLRSGLALLHLIHTTIVVSELFVRSRRCCYQDRRRLRGSALRHPSTASRTDCLGLRSRECRCRANVYFDADLLSARGRVCVSVDFLLEVDGWGM